jgi:HD superfamily phosphohydrolase
MSQKKTINIPIQYCNSLIASPESPKSAFAMITTALNYIANTRPLHDSFDNLTADDYDNGKQLILEHLANMTSYADELMYEKGRETLDKVKLLESNIDEYKEFNRLQSIINNPEAYYQNYLETENKVDSVKIKNVFESTYIVGKKIRFEELKASLGINDEPNWERCAAACA